MSLATQSGDVKVAGSEAAQHNGGLLLVALFKLGKAIFFFAVGLGALKLLNHDIGDIVQRLVVRFNMDTEGHFVHFLLDRADLIGNHQLRRTALFSILYSCVCVVEGIGLYKEKEWAEYFTVTLTVLALPWELFELWRDPTGFRVGLLVLNLLVLGYLLWIIRWNRRKRASK